MKKNFSLPVSLYPVRLLIIASLVAAICVPAYRARPVSATSALQSTDTSDWSRDTVSGAFVYYGDNGEIRCRPATEEEALALETRDPLMPLRVISPRTQGLTPQADGRLHIVLRGTPQLDAFPQARDAFLRAAASWEALIRADITIVIDVDFGPTRFGQPFPPGVIGTANSQQLGKADGYTDARNALIAGAGSAQELALFNSLPQGAVPTDIGDTTLVFAPSATARALGLIAPIADPDGEQAQFGPPPSIVFNSNPGVQYDFDPRDGITPGQVDFEALAAHEAGHVLGFTSFVGVRELDPNRDVALAVWDLFRFRPGAAPAAQLAPASFTSAQRILSSGGEQVFFAGGPEAPLSTGRPDGTGGDGFQAAHWKDDRFTGQIIGVMDPIITAGDRGVITDSDLAVLNGIGYGADVADPGAPSLKSVSFDGSRLTIKGNDLQGNLQLEINCEVVAPPLRVKPKASGKKAKVPGSQEQLNLQNGANQVRLMRDGLRSNVFVLNL